jgi:hypothetical protein
VYAHHHCPMYACRICPQLALLPNLITQHYICKILQWNTTWLFTWQQAYQNKLIVIICMITTLIFAWWYFFPLYFLIIDILI